MLLSLNENTSSMTKTRLVEHDITFEKDNHRENLKITTSHCSAACDPAQSATRKLGFYDVFRMTKKIFVNISVQFMTFFRARHILMTIIEYSSLTLNENRRKLSDCCTVPFFYCHIIARAVVTNL